MSTIEAVKRAANWTASEPDEQRQCLQCRQMEWRIEGKYRPWCLEHGFFSLPRAGCDFHQGRNST